MDTTPPGVWRPVPAPTHRVDVDPMAERVTLDLPLEQVAVLAAAVGDVSEVTFRLMPLRSAEVADARQELRRRLVAELEAAS